MPQPLTPAAWEHLDQIAGMIVRLDRALKGKRRSKEKEDKKANKKAKTVAAIERDQTDQILFAIDALAGQLRGALPRVRERIELQLADADAPDRREQGQRRFARWWKKKLPALEAACREAKDRIQVVMGRDSGRAARSVVEQLARVWVSAKGIEPTFGRKRKKDSFDSFVDVVLDESNVHFFDRYNLIRKVVEYRESGIVTVKTKRDSESDNPRSDQS